MAITQKISRHLVLSLLPVLLVACSASEGKPPQEYIAPESARTSPTPAFSMKPSVLEEGTVFMRRTADKIPTANTSGRARSTQPVHTDPADWIPLEDYRLVLSVDNMTLENIVAEALDQARPYTGPWTVKWKISADNADIIEERFSLNAETTFEEFTRYVADTILNYRGVKLAFKMFRSQRIIVVTDKG